MRWSFESGEQRHCRGCAILWSLDAQKGVQPLPTEALDRRARDLRCGRVHEENAAFGIEADDALTCSQENVLRVRLGDFVPAPGNDVGSAGRSNKAGVDGCPFPWVCDGLR